jgi:DNA-binding NarL/FixJ family response regulator
VAGIRKLYHETKILIMTTEGKEKVVITALRMGAFDFLAKPLSADFLYYAIKRALDAQRMERENRKIFEELRTRNKELMDMNELLSELTGTMEKACRATERQLRYQIQTLILPIVAQLRQESTLQPYAAQLAQLAGHLEAIGSGAMLSLHGHDGLSGRERQMALLIRAGLTNEEIATQLHISPETVKTHRRNIRKKLGITGSKKRLGTYLHALEDHRPMPEERRDLSIRFSTQAHDPFSRSLSQHSPPWELTENS